MSFFNVSILVLVEVGLKEDNTLPLRIISKPVSILVLVEVGLKEDNATLF